MKVSITGSDSGIRTYDVFWEHGIADRETKCTINMYTHIRGEFNHIINGLAECSVRDQYCKETGRKVSLAKALKAVKFTRDERTEFWKAYFNRDAKAIST
jgi:hypothetical protein